ncbi:flavodoxin [Virgibacillus kimchii]
MMNKILVVYASQTGNTELMAESMIALLEHNKIDVTTKTFDFDPIDVEELAAYDAVLIGTHTWDDGDLPYEVEDFYEELEDVNIENHLFAVFGSCDSFYDTYGGAIDLMGERLEELGARVVSPWLKVDLEPNQNDIKACENLAERVMLHIAEKV